VLLNYQNLATGLAGIQDIPTQGQDPARIAATQTHKVEFPAGTLLIQLGGPGMRIGMGGGAASSMAAGANAAELDFDSVQRGNAEIQRRAQEVIDRCWQLGDANPILSIHDVGAGGLSNALPELVEGADRGALFNLRAIPSEEPGMSPREIWCNEAQERYVLALAPDALGAFAAICARERCPWSLVGGATAERRLVVDDPAFANAPVDVDAEGFLTDPGQWSFQIAEAIAAANGIAELTDRHWLVVRFMRERYLVNGVAPSIRSLGKESGVPIKELYQLFPKGPAKLAAKIGGIPKPKGCI
jgi:phosphoribosylformylglycinamidine synthase